MLTPPKDPKMDSEASEKYEKVVLKVQRWYSDWKDAKTLREKLASVEVSLKVVRSCLVDFNTNESFERAHNMLQSESYTRSLGKILQVIAASKSLRQIKHKTNILHLTRVVSSALMISKFPDQVLFSDADDSEGGASQHFEVAVEVKRCLVDAKTLFAQLEKVLVATSSATTRRQFHSAFHTFVYALSAFLKSFEDWRKADSQRLASSLQESFAQTYSVYIASMRKDSTDEIASPELVVASQQQLERIRNALVRTLGKHEATSRIEEICAAVEAAYYTMAADMPDSADGESSPVPRSDSPPLQSPKGSAPSLSATLLPGQPLTRPGALSASPGGDAGYLAEMTQSALSPSHTKVLDKLSLLAGIDQERLAYEIVLNPYYRLPTPADTAATTTEAPQGYAAISNSLRRSDSNQGGSFSGASGSSKFESGLQRSSSNQTLSNAVSLQDTASVVQSLRSQMLRMMGDKLVNSLRSSNIQSLSELRVGQIVPVFFMPNGHTPEQYTAGTGSRTFTFTRTPIMTGKIVAIPDAVGDLDAAQPATVDVEYLCDGIREDGVFASRIVLAGAAVPDPSPLLLSLQDLAMQIASFTPNRPDIQQEVMATVDTALLSQMVVTRSLDPVTDLLPILQYFQRSLQALQAPSRTATTDAWIRQLTESFYKVDNTAESANSAGSSSQRRGRSLDEVAPLLPPFFERATSIVEEIQRDMANYYISVLVPVLQQQGSEYLGEKFQARVHSGMVSLDATASLLYSQIQPEEALQATVRDLVEAGGCPETGFTVADIITSAAAPPPPSLNGIQPAAPKNLVDGVVARAMLALLQLPFRLDSVDAVRVLPETLSWDAPRLAAMRDLVDRISLECSLVIACRQVMGRYQLPAWCSDAAAEVELQHRLDVLLTEKDTSLASITTEVVRYVQEALQKFREAQLTTTASLPGSPRATAVLKAASTTHPALIGGDPQEVQERVSKALKDVVAQGNPVLALFNKRVYKVLLRAMLGQGFKHLLASYSLQSPAQQRNLAQLLQSACRLFAHTMRIHREVYTAIIARATISST